MVRLEIAGAALGVCISVSAVAVAEPTTPSEVARRLLLLEAGFEYGSYHGELGYDATLRDVDGVTRLAGVTKLDGTPTYGTKLLAGASVESPSRFWGFQIAGGLGLRTARRVEAFPDTEFRPASVRLRSYSADLELVGRIATLWGWIYLEAAPGLHSLFGFERVEYADSHQEDVDSAWAISVRLGSGIRVPLFGPWKLRWGGGAAVMARPLPWFARTYGVVALAWEGEP